MLFFNTHEYNFFLYFLQDLHCVTTPVILSGPKRSPLEDLPYVFFRPWWCKYLIMCGNLLSSVTLWSLLVCSHDHNYIHSKYVPGLVLELSIKWPLWSWVRNGVHSGCAWSLCRSHSEKMLLAEAKERVGQINYLRTYTIQ